MYSKGNMMTSIFKSKIIINKIADLNIIIFLGIICYFISSVANAVDTQSNAVSKEIRQLAQLKVTPKPCVALRKGQKCYLEVTFNWLHPQASDYCLVNTTTNNTMKCWSRQAKGEFKVDFQSRLSNDFALRRPKSTTDLARTKIPVAWVYKSTKRAKSTWRIF